LFEPGWKFAGFEAAAFEAFGIPDRETRRREIIARFHPALESLAEDLVDRLAPDAGSRLHRHLPRLDWPQGYQPFCTWLVLSTMAHGYQAAPQLNIGVHRDHVGARLGWDVAAASYGRFEFRCRHARLGGELEEVARRVGLAFRVYASAPWPEGSRLVYTSDEDWRGSLDEAARRGVWWELGRRWDLPAAGELVHSAALGPAILEVVEALVPLYLKSLE